MSGHSKWATIKRKKAAEDSKRGKAFTRTSKEITVAARVGGKDPQANPRLRHLIEKAREINMPLENVERAIKRGSGELPGVHYESHLYEGYGPEGIAVIVETLTDNKNRTVADLRRIFSNNGGSLAEGGAVAWMFAKYGVIQAHHTDSISEDTLLEHLIDYDLKDMSVDKNTVSITCEPKALEEVKRILQQHGFKINSAEIEWVAQTTLALEGAQEELAIAFLEKLEDCDDVQHIYTNLK
jgi:YebC/PmpR family DNA-binding regulatory protein